MTLVRRESLPVSEAQTIIRSHYLRPWPTIAGFRREPTTVTQEVVVVGCGVNYDANRGAGRPIWVASQDSLQLAAKPDAAFECTAGPIEMRLPNDAASPLVLAKNGTRVACSLLGAAGVRAEKKNDRTALYRNALPDTDLEWKVGKGFMKETLIVRSRNAPAAFSFALRADAGTKFLVPTRTGGAFGYRDVLAATTAGHPERVDGSVLIAREGGTTRGLMRMLPATVRDADGHTTAMLATLSRAADGSLLYTIAVPPAFWSARERKFPLAVDPTFINVPNEEYPYLYEAGKTYYIASPVGYSYPTVIVEANAVLKFGPEDCYLCFQRLYESEPEPMLLVQGTPYNYAVFTSGYDDSVGADTDGPPPLPLSEGNPAPGVYDYAINFWSSYWGTMNEIEINYAKFAYAGRQNPYSPYPGAAILMAGPNMEGNETIGGSVSNCVFDSNLKALALLQGFYRPLHFTVHNCLFLGSQYGIYFDGKLLELDVRNCTFDGRGGDTAIWLNGREGGYAVATMVNNVFAHYATGVYKSYYGCLCDLDYSGLYDLQSFCDGDIWPGLNWWEATAPPFDTNANGSYYLKEIPDDSDFRDKGSCSAESAGLSGKATRAATVANGRVKQSNITQLETWTRFEEQFDTGQLDLGYHYDPVDIIIDPIVATGETSRSLKVMKPQGGPAPTLWINPGVVVAFSADTVHPVTQENVATSTSLVIGDECNIDAQGTGNQRIRFTSCAASGDRVGHPGNRGMFEWYWRAIQLGDDWDGSNHNVGAKSRIRYCDFSWCGDGVLITAWPHTNVLDINNCRFSYCFTGILSYMCNAGGNPVMRVVSRNNLFHHLFCEGVTVWTNSQNAVDYAGVVNCTFDNMLKGMTIVFGHAVIKNCIFSNCEYWYRLHNPPETPNPMIDYCYGNNPGFDPGTPPVADIDQRYYLDQGASPCVDTGDPAIGCYQTTARYLGLDYTRVDMGYHYPVRGRLKIAPNFFFEWENGESFYPIGASNMPYAYEDTTATESGFYPTTVPLYLQYLKKHGVNMLRIYPFAQSTLLQDSEYDEQSQTKGRFLPRAIKEYDRYFDALEGEGLCYVIATYDYSSMTSTPVCNCIYYAANGGTVPDDAWGTFFKPDAGLRKARTHFQRSLDQFLDSHNYGPQWSTREGLVGWDVYSELDMSVILIPWGDGFDPENPDADLLADHEDTVTSWGQVMLSYMDDGEKNRRRGQQAPKSS